MAYVWSVEGSTISTRSRNHAAPILENEQRSFRQWRKKLKSFLTPLLSCRILIFLNLPNSTAFTSNTSSWNRSKRGSMLRSSFNLKEKTLTLFVSNLFLFFFEWVSSRSPEMIVNRTTMTERYPYPNLRVHRRWWGTHWHPCRHYSRCQWRRALGRWVLFEKDVREIGGNSLLVRTLSAAQDIAIFIGR